LSVFLKDFFCRGESFVLRRHGPIEDHPYYTELFAWPRKVDRTSEQLVSALSRLTGLGLAYSAFNPVGILFNTLLSCNNRYTSYGTGAGKNNVPYLGSGPVA
jgi:hypothetical protein